MVTGTFLSINLSFGFEYVDKQMLYDQADYLCRELHIPLVELRHHVFDKEGKPKLKNEQYIELRKKFTKDFCEGDGACMMELKVTKANIVKMLVLMQSSQDKAYGRNLSDAKFRGLKKLQIHKTQDFLGRPSLPYREDAKLMVEKEAGKRKLPAAVRLHMFVPSGRRTHTEQHHVMGSRAGLRSGWW